MLYFTNVVIYNWNTLVESDVTFNHYNYQNIW